MKRILIAFDGSESSLKAVDYVSQQFSAIPDVHITLFHVMAGLPPELWDEGHIFSDKEQAARKTIEGEWLAKQKLKFEPVLQAARKMLTKHGITLEQIDTKYVSETIAVVSDCILAEAQAGRYQTLVIGRCGRHHAKHLLLGSITSKIVHYSSRLAICVVG